MIIRMNFSKFNEEIPSERKRRTIFSVVSESQVRDGAERAKQTVLQLMADGPLVSRVKVARAFFQELTEAEVMALKPATQERLFGLRAEYTAVKEDFVMDCALLIAAMLEDWRRESSHNYAVA